MAKNWTIAEAVKVFEACKDNEAIADIGRRFPTLANLLARIVVGDKNAAVDMLSKMPEFMTAGKMDKALKAGAEKTEDDDEDEKDSNDSNEKSDNDYSNMSAKALYELAKERKIKLTSTKKADMIAALEEFDNGGLKEEKEEKKVTKKETKKNDDEDADDDSVDYSKMSAVELFKECKKRGIKAATRQEVEVYIELLKEDDAKKAEPEDEDGWDDNDDEVEEKKPAKTEKKSEKKSKKEEKDDDEDWDI